MDYKVSFFYISNGNLYTDKKKHFRRLNEECFKIPPVIPTFKHLVIVVVILSLKQLVQMKILKILGEIKSI